MQIGQPEFPLRLLLILLFRFSAKTNLAKALNYALGRWEDLCLYTTDSRIGIDNNPAERALRGIAINPKTICFSAPKPAASALPFSIKCWNPHKVLESAKLNGLDPEAYLTNVIDRMAKGHTASRLKELPRGTGPEKKTPPIKQPRCSAAFNYPHTQDDDLTLEVPSFERFIRADRFLAPHPSPIPPFPKNTRHANFAPEPCRAASLS
jgi:hypothetical protein